MNLDIKMSDFCVYWYHILNVCDDDYCLSTESQESGDDNVVEMTSSATESVLRERDVACSPSIPLKQTSVTSNVGQ